MSYYHLVPSTNATEDTRRAREVERLVRQDLPGLIGSARLEEQAGRQEYADAALEMARVIVASAGRFGIDDVPGEYVSVVQSYRARTLREFGYTEVPA